MNAPIRNRHGERIAYTFAPGGGANDQLVILGHGVTSDRERPWSQALAAGLQEHGIASIRIAWSGNGESEGAFADSNITKEVEDLGAVIDAVSAQGFRVSYAGHSMGGAVGVVRTSQDDRIQALVSLAAMVHTAEFATRMFGHLGPGEFMLDKPHCPLSPTYMADLQAIGTVVDRGVAIEVPWLLVHGTEDDIVPPSHSRDIHAASGERGRLVELEGVDHSFSGEGLHAMTRVVVPWLAERLT